MNTAASLAALEGQAGYHETGVNRNIFTPWQTNGAWSAAAWCDSFAQWGAVGNGGFAWQDSCQWGPNGDSYCPYTVNHAKELGLWQDASASPQPGWQVLFSWNRNGIADHIGTIVEDRGNGTFTTIEGNTSDQVAFRVRDRTYIMGFVALHDDAPAPPPPPQPTDQTDPPLVWYVRKPMMQGSSIGWMQAFLKQECGQSSLSIDGWYGNGSRAAVVNYQRFFNLQIDGAVGNETWGSMQYIASLKGFSY